MAKPFRFRMCLAVAQRIEHIDDYGAVVGSNPASETTPKKPWELVPRGFFVFKLVNLKYAHDRVRAAR